MTGWLLVFHISISLQIALAVSAYVVPELCSLQVCGQDSISLTLYIHGGMWFVLFILDRFLALKHKESRLNGYLDFYRRTQNIRIIPFQINSCGNDLCQAHLLNQRSLAGITKFIDLTVNRSPFIGFIGNVT